MKKRAVDISIIIVNYNTKKLTIDCVDSIVKSVTNYSFEIIIVDNASTDGSLDAISKLKNPPSQQANKKPKVQIEIIKNSDNLGFSKANNQGIKIAKGKYVLLLNSDTKVKKNSIDELVKFADKTKDCGVVGSKLLNKDGSIQPSCFNFPTVWRAIKQYWLKYDKSLNKFAPNGQKPSEVEAVVGAALLVTPKAVIEVGLLDERFFFYYEDLDYCRRVRRVGLKVYYLPTAEIIHYHGASAEVDKSGSYNLLVNSSKIYHGLVKHYLVNFIIWSGQKFAYLHKSGEGS